MKINNRVIGSLLAWSLGALLVSAPAGADGETLAESEVERRLNFLEERLDATRRHGSLWTFGWGGLSGASTVVQGVLAGTSDSHDNRVMFATEAGKSAIGVADLWFRPLRAREGFEPFRVGASGDPQIRLATLRAAEARLEQNAARAKQRRSWLPHIGNLAINLAAGGIVAGLADDSDAAINTALGIVGGELQIWSEPSRPAADLEDYQRFVRRDTARARGGWTLSTTPRGIQAEFRF